jgi:hypothetical protein
MIIGQKNGSEKEDKKHMVLLLIYWSMTDNGFLSFWTISLAVLRRKRKLFNK